MAAVLTWKYKPATLDGKPVAVIFTETLELKPPPEELQPGSADSGGNP